MIDRIPDLTPIAVLADRSRDASAHAPIPALEPHGVFQVTDNRRRLTARLLRKYDLVTIVGHGTLAYSAAERRGLREFVERGGSLVLAASAGEFEAESGLPISRLAVNGVAREFGFDFLTADGYPRDRRFRCRHALRRHLELTPAGRRVGLKLRENHIWYPAAIATPPRATVLLREKGSGAPVAARTRIGRGTVLVWGDSSLFCNGWTLFPATLWLASVAPRRRRPAERPPLVIDVPREERTEGAVTVRASVALRARAAEVLEIADKVWRQVCRELSPAKKPRRVHVLLEPGCSIRGAMGASDEHRLVLGADYSDASTVATLVRMFVFRLLYARWGGRRFWPFVDAAQHAIKIRLLERMGFTDDAAEWEELYRGGRRVDFAAVYSGEVYLPREIVRFFRSAEAEFGAGVLRDLCRKMPKKEPFKDLPQRYYSALDTIAYYLARVRGPRVYEWLESGGHTVRRIPLKEPASDALRRAVTRSLEKALADGDAPASDRADAAYALADLRVAAKDSPAVLARAANGEKPERAIPAALVLARSRDDRGRPALSRLARSRNETIAATAALLAVAEGGETRAADRLVGAAESADTRFKLMTGQALARVGDPRAEGYSFDRLPGCRLTTWENGTHRVFAEVDGRRVAVIITGPTWEPRGEGTANSRYYVFWVHTRGAYRRFGIARAGMKRAMGHRLAKTCSEVCLHAMSDYYAHALYRELGLFDSEYYRKYRKPPEPSTRRAPRGVRVRPARPEDAPGVGALLVRICRPQSHFLPQLSDWPSPEVSVVAEEGGKPVGVAMFLGHRLFAFAVDDAIEKKERREAVGLALLAAAERLHRDRGTKEIEAITWLFIPDEYHRGLLLRAGYASSRDALVEQAGIVDLTRYLREIRVLLEARLEKEKSVRGWSGTIRLEAGPLAAALRIDAGRIRVPSRAPARASIALRTDPESLVRILRGIETPFDAFNQTRLTVAPAMSGPVRKLLETLFPKLAVD